MRSRKNVLRKMPESTYDRGKSRQSRKRPKEGNSEGKGLNMSIGRRRRNSPLFVLYGVNGSSQLAGCGSSPVSGGSYSPAYDI
jgi:hypothetical protein